MRGVRAGRSIDVVSTMAHHGFQVGYTTSRMTADILILSPLHLKAVRRLEEGFTTHAYFDAAHKTEFLADRADLIRGIATMGEVTLGADLMDRLPRLEIISCFGVGYDSIDIDAAKERGIIITNTPGVLTDDVADLAIALMISVARRLMVAERYLRAGEWARRGAMALATSCSGKNAGVLGLGRIGTAIARRCEAMGLTVAYHNRRPRSDVGYSYVGDPVALAGQSAFLIVACPGGPETENLVDARVLQALGPEGYLVNVSRGSVVDEAALVKALADGTIKGAGLDVFADEPNVPVELTEMDNVVLVPHVGSATSETREAMADLMVDNLVAHFSGQPIPTRVV